MKYKIKCDANFNDEQKSQIIYQLKYYYHDISNIDISNGYISLMTDISIDLKKIDFLIEEIKNRKQIDSKEIFIDSIKVLDSELIENIKEYIKNFKAKYLMNPKGIKKKYAFYIDKDIVKLELVDKLFFEIFTKISPFTNMKAPNIISVRELMKSKYLDNTFHHIMFGVGLDKRISNLGEFKNSNKDKFDISREHLENPNVCLNPALCLHCYRLSENKSFKSGELDAYSVLGNCYRDEGGNNNQKERLKEFIMREYVAIGDSEQIKETRKLLLGLMELVFRELSIPVKFKTATDIFFSDSNGAKTFMQLLSASKIEIVYHSRGSNNSFSIGSINSHGSHFTKPYKITMFNNIQVAESLCCGIGYDRLLIALEENLYEE